MDKPFYGLLVLRPAFSFNESVRLAASNKFDPQLLP